MKLRNSTLVGRRRLLLAGLISMGFAASAKAGGDTADECARFRDALERIAMLDEADGHALKVKHAFEAVEIACHVLGDKHPSQIFMDREARKTRL